MQRKVTMTIELDEFWEMWGKGGDKEHLPSAIKTAVEAWVGVRVTDVEVSDG